jgi:hypothetical protein
MRILSTSESVGLMLISTVMLAADVVAAALWIAVIAVGIAIVAIDRYRHQGQHRA